MAEGTFVSTGWSPDLQRWIMPRELSRIKGAYNNKTGVFYGPALPPSLIAKYGHPMEWPEGQQSPDMSADAWRRQVAITQNNNTDSNTYPGEDFLPARPKPKPQPTPYMGGEFPEEREYWPGPENPPNPTPYTGGQTEQNKTSAMRGTLNMEQLAGLIQLIFILLLMQLMRR